MVTLNKKLSMPAQKLGRYVAYIQSYVAHSERLWEAWPSEFDVLSHTTVPDYSSCLGVEWLECDSAVCVRPWYCQEWKDLEIEGQKIKVWPAYQADEHDQALALRCHGMRVRRELEAKKRKEKKDLWVLRMVGRSVIKNRK
jgi:hypothetical protein